MQYSFYGGQQGKNFAISAVFKNKVEMMTDLMKRYQSSIGVGELVLISYGMPNQDSPSYRNNVDIDMEAYGHTYNSTLWQKIYTEQNSKEISDVTGIEIEYVSKDFGIGYKLIAVLTGNTPVFKIRDTIIRDVNQDPDVILDVTNLDEPTLQFLLPQAQQILPAHVSTDEQDADFHPTVVFDVSGNNSDGTKKINRPAMTFKLPQAQQLLPEHVSTKILDANEDPTVEFDVTGNNSDSTKKINRPSMEFQLPQAQQLLPQHVKLTVLNAGETPAIVFDIVGTYADEEDDDGNPIKKINQPYLEFKLPQGQTLGLGKVTVVDADQLPKVSIDNSDINNPKLVLELPRSQVLQLQPMVTLPPLSDPSFEYDDSDEKINFPELTFQLPRAVRFMYGDRLGERSKDQYILTLTAAPEIVDLRPGDYYVNKTTGFIYMVTAEDPLSRTFEFKACLAAPEPDITSSIVNPYEKVDGVWKVKDPVLEPTYSNPTEMIGLILGFKLPRLPNLAGEVEFCGPDEDGSVTGEITGENEFTYSFVIPSGARFFCGSLIDDDTLNAAVDGARPGDFYINGNWNSASDGNIYKMTREGRWVYNGNIKGDPGDPLNIVDSFTITSDEVAEDSLTAVSEYLQETLLNGNKPKENEIIGVTYEATDDSGTTSIAYWYYIVKGQWHRAQLTGSMKNFIENEYTESPEDDPIVNKTYSIDYINKLIGGKLTEENKGRTTFSKDQLIALFSWNSFAEAEDGSWWPEIGEDKDTLSAEEILSLMSWGSMAALSLKEEI